MPFKKHDQVFHRRLEADGVVLDVLANGRYRVGIGNLTVECRETDLVLRKDGPTAYTKRGGRAVSAPAKRAKSRGPARSASIDLHGMTVDEALEAVGAAIDSAIVGGADALRIVHGHGTGRIRAAVHRYLGSLPVVKRYRLDEQNAGVTWAHF